MYLSNRPLKAVIAIGLCTLLGGCASQRPVLYPNAHLKSVGERAAEADVNDCMDLATRSSASANRGERVAKKTGQDATVGAVTGAVAGAIGGNAGTGAAIGAAGGAAHGLTRSMFDSAKPDPVFKEFVGRCLRDRGYDPIGWR